MTLKTVPYWEVECDILGCTSNLQDLIHARGVSTQKDAYDTWEDAGGLVFPKPSHFRTICWKHIDDVCETCGSIYIVRWDEGTYCASHKPRSRVT